MAEKLGGCGCFGLERYTISYRYTLRQVYDKFRVRTVAVANYAED
ncbi:MAG: hypothetical protein ACETWM_20040 [Candidatus Lokiarchaeia archaeon]